MILIVLMFKIMNFNSRRVVKYNKYKLINCNTPWHNFAAFSFPLLLFFFSRNQVCLRLATNRTCQVCFHALNCCTLIICIYVLRKSIYKKAMHHHYHQHCSFLKSLHIIFVILFGGIELVLAWQLKQFDGNVPFNQMVVGTALWTDMAGPL